MSTRSERPGFFSFPYKLLSPSSVVYELHFFLKGRNNKKVRNLQHMVDFFPQPAWTPAVSTLELDLGIRRRLDSSGQ